MKHEKIKNIEDSLFSVEFLVAMNRLYFEDDERTSRVTDAIETILDDYKKVMRENILLKTAIAVENGSNDEK